MPLHGPDGETPTLGSGVAAGVGDGAGLVAAGLGIGLGLAFAVTLAAAESDEVALAGGVEAMRPQPVRRQAPRSAAARRRTDAVRCPSRSAAVVPIAAPSLAAPS
jgi:hypothetical protein